MALYILNQLTAATVSTVLFARCSPKMTELGVFVSKPFTNFKKATEKLNQHFFEKQFHKSAVETALMFHKVQCNQMPSVDKQLITLRQDRIAQNRLNSLRAVGLYIDHMNN